jgi:hypothetical protein
MWRKGEKEWDKLTHNLAKNSCRVFKVFLCALKKDPTCWEFKPCLSSKKVEKAECLGVRSPRE